MKKGISLEVATVSQTVSSMKEVSPADWHLAACTETGVLPDPSRVCGKEHPVGTYQDVEPGRQEAVLAASPSTHGPPPGGVLEQAIPSVFLAE